MITKVTLNKVREGCKEAYAEVSKEFEAALVERTNCLSAKTYFVEGDDTTVVNIEVWPDAESASFNNLKGIFGEFAPRLGQYFAGNSDMTLTEV